MQDFLGNWKRTNLCANISNKEIDKEVILMGWIQRKRILGGIYFIDLRDNSGIVQLLFNERTPVQILEKIKNVTNESVIAVKGIVAKRSSINENIKNGDIEIIVNELKVLSLANNIPIHISDDDNANELLRMQYRYLDLRKPKMQKILRTRAKITRTIREFLDSNNFVDIETPILTKPTPEGARDYLVPSRVNPNKFYALPQSPQIFKQLLMVSGFDRYYQIARCFRDEDLRADRQPEFTQIDMEMSFVEVDDVRNIVEQMFKKIFKEIINVDLPEKFDVMSYDEAMDKFGSDKPDRRYKMYLTDISEIFEKTEFEAFKKVLKIGKIKAINVENGVNEFSTKGLKNLEKLAKTYGAKALSYIKFADEISSPILKFLSEIEINQIKEKMNVKENDLILIVADKKDVVNTVLGGLRIEIAKKLNLINEDEFNILWVIDFPLFEYDEELGRYFAKHHPFTSPRDEDLEFLELEPDRVKAKAYDLVINGYEVGGGSIRIFNQNVQKRMFKALGFTQESIDEKFGFLVKGLQYGTPPHGGIAFGLDRLTMILTKTDNIKDVVAFPKTQAATCPLSNAPSYASDEQLEELYLNLVRKD